ncbi:hypothetical protein AN477_11725 [Alicyclobacillus ferrooxydans]|uniref:Uncharacterized protein n=1 Tax=Alicyclobacillus ferrooxydans TaxID=471514 RepID=A0A0P9GRB5_9BACL|nr:hypothetical protein AN477_11725 [Alicyclobacillus ferrooxydans]
MIGHKSNLGTVYFLGVTVVWLAVLVSTVTPLHHQWPMVILIALFVTILEISPANVHVASITVTTTVTTSVVLASTTNFGLFPAELSLLLSLPFLLIYFRRGAAQ